MAILVFTYDTSTGGFRTQLLNSAQIANQGILSANYGVASIASGHLVSAIIGLLGTVADSAITSSKIAAAAIGGVHIYSGSIAGANLANQLITSSKIAANIIATPHIANQGILSASFGAAIIGAPHLAALAITSGKVASGGLSPLSSGYIWAGFTGNMPREETVPSGGGFSIFGDGSDGVGTITGTPTTLSRDMYYSNLTVNSTKTLDCAGYRVFVSGTLTNNGTISRNGNDGGNASAGVGGTAGAALAAGSLGGSAGGAAGKYVGTSSQQRASTGGGGSGGGVLFIAAKTIVNNGTISANGGNAGTGHAATGTTFSAIINGIAGNATTDSLGGAVSVAGNGVTTQGTGTGGAAATATAPAATEGDYNAIPQAVLLRLTSAHTQIYGGAGAPSGGASAYTTTESAAGGSSGGGGGVLIMIYNSLTSGTETANGGTKSVGVKYGTGTCTDGSNGTVGTVIKIANA